MTTQNLNQTELEQKKYYNEIAETYDKYYSSKYALAYRYKVYDQLLKNENLKNAKVLDAMCGGGESSGYFIKKGAELTALDISENQCKIYSERYPGTRVVCSSITKTNFTDEEFDFVVTDSLHHLHPNVDEGVNEIYRILKKDGYLLIFEPSAGSVFDYLRSKWYSMDKTYFNDNEQSIDIDILEQQHKNQFKFTEKIYGGNIGYLLVQESMVFRIPPKLIKFYAPVVIPLDFFLQKLQGKRTACWILSLLRKK